jgi:hypothetical protein
MKKYFLFLLFAILFGKLFSQTQFLGYHEDCLGIQSIKIDSILKETIGLSRYTQLIELNQCKNEYKILVHISIDSLGCVNKINIIDKKNFLIHYEIKSFEIKLSQTIFNICFDAIEAKHLTLSELFKDKQTISYGVFLPFQK